MGRCTLDESSPLSTDDGRPQTTDDGNGGKGGIVVTPTGAGDKISFTFLGTDLRVALVPVSADAEVTDTTTYRYYVNVTVGRSMWRQGCRGMRVGGRTLMCLRMGRRRM